MTTDTFVKSQLALWAWRNAPAGKPFSALQCLAFIQRNRVKAGWMGGDWLSVIANDPTYSAYINLSPGSPHRGPGRPLSSMSALEEFPDLREDAFQRFLWEVDRIHDGSRGDPMTEGALWWGELEKINRVWFLDSIVRKPEQHPRVAQVATLTLWR